MTGFAIAQLNLLYETQEEVLVINRPPCLRKFTVPFDQSESFDTLKITFHPIESCEITQSTSWKNCIAANKIWEFWEVDDTHFGLKNLKKSNPLELVIDTEFKRGVLKGSKVEVLPQDLEIVLFSNWLAEYGDVILHASAVLSSEGVTLFCGESGSGKSTVVQQVIDTPGLTILGEDQVILRKIGDDLLVFGTPWHTNPELCSPAFGKLRRINFLKKTGSNYESLLSPADGVAQLIRTAFIPFYRRELLPGIVNRLAEVAEQVPVYDFSYTLDRDLSFLM